MTDRVKWLIENTGHSWDFKDNHPEEYEELQKKRKQILNDLTLEELESMKGEIDGRFWAFSVLPRIEKRKQERKAS